MPLRKYRPSSGTEGMMFEDTFCNQCIHEKFCHTQNHDDVACEILSNAFLFDINDSNYPKEWVYGEDGKPTCTNYKHWDWGNDNDENGLNEPPIIEPDDPMQLCMPFIIEETLKQELCQ